MPPTGPHRPATPGCQAVVLALFLVGLWAVSNPLGALATGFAVTASVVLFRRYARTRSRRP